MLSFAAFKCGVAVAGNEHAVVGKGAHLRSDAGVLYEQADVANGVILAPACRAHNGYAPLALLQQKAHGFCLVVGFLFGNDVQQMGIFGAVIFAN